MFTVRYVLLYYYRLCRLCTDHRNKNGLNYVFKLHNSIWYQYDIIALKVYKIKKEMPFVRTDELGI